MLIKQINSSFEEIFNNLLSNEKNTNWSLLTTHFALEYLNSIDKEKYSYIKGFLKKEDFFNIKLPSHGHLKDFKTGILLFPKNTLVIDIVEYYENQNINYTKDCSDLICFL